MAKTTDIEEPQRVDTLPNIAEQKIRAQAHVIGLLNEVERVLTGWVLGEDQDKVAKLTSPLYDLCDKRRVYMSMNFSTHASRLS